MLLFHIMLQNSPRPVSTLQCVIDGLTAANISRSCAIKETEAEPCLTAVLFILIYRTYYIIFYIIL